MVAKGGVERQNGGTQSLDAALRVLQILARSHDPVALSELARQCAMPPSKVHRYLASFQQARLVAQTGRSGKYYLGSGAVEVGLAALARHDFVNEASDGLADLRAETQMTALLAVWGSHGATVVRWERAESPTVTSMGLGTTLPLLTSATGRAFLAWTPRHLIRSMLDTELARVRKSPSVAPDLKPTLKSVETIVGGIRRLGYARIEGAYIPGLFAIAAPILDWQQEAQAVVTLIGVDPASVAEGSSPIAKLLAFVAERSLGRQS